MDLIQIFTEINNPKLKYVLMTGNVDLEKAFSGKGDIDILVNKGLSTEELLRQTKKYVSYVEIGIKILTQRGFSILHVDRSLSLDINVNKIVDLLNRIIK